MIWHCFYLYCFVTHINELFLFAFCPLGVSKIFRLFCFFRLHFKSQSLFPSFSISSVKWRKFQELNLITWLVVLRDLLPLSSFLLTVKILTYGGNALTSSSLVKAFNEESFPVFRCFDSSNIKCTEGKNNSFGLFLSNISFKTQGHLFRSCSNHHFRHPQPPSKTGPPVWFRWQTKRRSYPLSQKTSTP